MFQVGDFEKLLANLTRAGFEIVDSKCHTSITSKKEKAWNSNHPLMYVDLYMKHVDRPAKFPEIVLSYSTCYGNAGSGSCYANAFFGKALDRYAGFTVKGTRREQFDLSTFGEFLTKHKIEEWYQNGTHYA